MKRKPPALPNTSSWSIFSKWTIRKIVFVAILIAIAVVFTIIGNQLLPIVSIPTIKISFIGLPVKITGFIFGPIIGFFVGFLSDILSMLFVPPSAYNPLYTLATAMNGLVSGIVGWFFLKFLKFYFGGEYRINAFEAKIFNLSIKYKKALDKNDLVKAEKYADLIIVTNNKKNNFIETGSYHLLLNINLTSAAILIISLIIFLVILVGFVVDQKYINSSIIKNRWGLMAFMISGFLTMLVFVFVARFKLSPSRYLILVPIIIFSALLEMINVPLLSVADTYALGTGNTEHIFVWIFTHVATSPVKIWFNMLIIYYSYSIIASLIYKNENLSY
ncbi:ECF transporter S component [Mycoplasma crocodyli]|uniref:Putative membrane protein n=1 Tax=Mycoplasma crocodyli (strain ATCC 51981 / MP145) TaxID=512564 RepID=D5E5X4_MYCCM|nr:ECF transporter S component [Mycoplasma crocodyli]ADE19946.1 putative membrane protein [Mycoplasma crocodyli MP145]